MNGAAWLSRCLLLVTIWLATSQSLHAAVAFNDLVAYQAFAADATSVVVNLGGYDPASSDSWIDGLSRFNYSSTFDDTGVVVGTFAGQYQSSSLTGTLSDSVVGDPTYNLTGGVDLTVATPGGQTKPAATQINLTIGNGGTLDGSKIGGKSGYDMTGVLAQTMNGNTYTYKGDVMFKGFGKGLNGKNYTGNVTITVMGTGLSQDVTSKIVLKNQATTWYDTGKVQFEPKKNGVGFNGIMNDSVTVVPEPSTLALASIASLFAFGYSALCRKGRRQPITP